MKTLISLEGYLWRAPPVIWARSNCFVLFSWIWKRNLPQNNITSSVRETVFSSIAAIHFCKFTSDGTYELGKVSTPFCSRTLNSTSHQDPRTIVCFPSLREHCVEVHCVLPVHIASSKKAYLDEFGVEEAYQTPLGWIRTEIVGQQPLTGPKIPTDTLQHLKVFPDELGLL